MASSRASRTSFTSTYKRNIAEDASGNEIAFDLRKGPPSGVFCHLVSTEGGGVVRRFQKTDFADHHRRAQRRRRDHVQYIRSSDVAATRQRQCFAKHPGRDRQHQVEDSLRQLRTDRVDLYQVHWPDPLVRIEDTAETLLELQREGKILALGVSNFSPEQMEAWRRVAPLHSTQPPYNIFEREIENDVLLGFAIRWILDRGETMTALWGARNAGQLDAVEQAFSWKLSSDDYAEVDRILRETIKRLVRKNIGP